MTHSHSRQRSGVLLASLAASLVLAACDAGARPKNEMRFVTDDFVIRVAAESLPIRALEPTHWRVVVSELKTGKPVENGQGRIFGTNKDRKTTANGLAPTGELGTYRTNMMFVTAGLWAMGIQFRRDSTQKLQQTTDWTQDVLTADEPGGIETPLSNRLPDPDSARKAEAQRKADSTAIAARRKKS
ncbi:MAG: hypothetical protein M3Y64_11240 [Gemmatimonadota bacterium]|nr:hypothetical protein [Gemmatimonadota bacterium]